VPTVVIIMAITSTDNAMVPLSLPLIRLLQLVSPTLPTGSFSYSQGLEWVVEQGWVNDASTLSEWLVDCLHRSLAGVDLPILREMYIACIQEDRERLEFCCDLLLACRESRELAEEETHRGRAMGVLLRDLGLVPETWQPTLFRSQLAGFAFAAQSWNIDLATAASGYLWAWLENQVIAGVKIIPLGQTAGQQLLLRLGELIPDIIHIGLIRAEDDIGAASPALALASTQHETQYTRLYRS